MLEGLEVDVRRLGANRLGQDLVHQTDNGSLPGELLDVGGAQLSLGAGLPGLAR